MPRISALLALALLAPSCANVARVHREESPGKLEDVKGIPFYVKRQKWKQTTEYAQLWGEMRIVVEEKRGSDGPKTTSVILRYFDLEDRGDGALRPALSRLSQMLGSFQDEEEDSRATLDTQRELMQDFLGLSATEPPPLPPSQHPDLMVANRIEAVAVVDYGRPYYLNAPLPWFGKSAFVPELSADGTLKKADVGVEQDIGESLSQLLPLKELLSSVFLPGAAAAAAETPERKITISVRIDGRRYVYTKLHDEPRSRLTPLGKRNIGDGFRIEPLEPARPKPAPPKTDGYSFSGTVTPPKAATK